MTIVVIIAALCAVIIFGASPVAAKIGVSAFPAIDVAILRTVIGGLVALPVILVLKIRFPRNRTHQRLLILSGFCGFVGFPIVFTLGVQLTSANHASLILASLPVFTSAIALGLDKKMPPLAWYTGCTLALTGEAVLIGTVAENQGQASLSGDLLVLLSNLFASVGYVAGGKLQQQGYSAIGTTFWGVIVFALPLLLILPLTVDLSVFPRAGIPAWSAIFYLAIGVTIIGYILWYWALGIGGIQRVGLLQFLQPVSGVVLAGWLLSEKVSLIFLLASVLILSGVWIAIRKKSS